MKRPSTYNAAINRVASQLFTDVTEKETWRRDAACLTEDPALFSLPDHDPESGLRLGAYYQLNYFQRGKEVCARCPVREACLDHALETNEEHGLWGGLTPTERRTRRDKLVAEGAVFAPRPRNTHAPVVRRTCKSCGVETAARGGVCQNCQRRAKTEGVA